MGKEKVIYHEKHEDRIHFHDKDVERINYVDIDKERINYIDIDKERINYIKRNVFVDVKVPRPPPKLIEHSFSWEVSSEEEHVEVTSHAAASAGGAFASAGATASSGGAFASATATASAGTSMFPGHSSSLLDFPPFRRRLMVRIASQTKLSKQ